MCHEKFKQAIQKREYRFQVQRNYGKANMQFNGPDAKVIELFPEKSLEEVLDATKLLTRAQLMRLRILQQEIEEMKKVIDSNRIYDNTP